MESLNDEPDCDDYDDGLDDDGDGDGGIYCGHHQYYY